MTAAAAATALPLLRPQWGVVPGVGAAMTLRAGGVSQGPWRAMNLGAAVGDAPAHVAANRERLRAALGARAVWLRQTHGTAVLRLDAVTPEHPPQSADAAWTSARGVACTVLVADCLPVLFALRDGSAVAAAHAGWRGLAAGVLEATVAALCQGTGASAADLLAWLGPCIGAQHFEVGADVVQAFAAHERVRDAAPFTACTRRDGSAGWLADLSQLARERLRAQGVRDITQAGACTVRDGERFFSYRRDGVTGRHAAAIWRLGAS